MSEPNHTFACEACAIGEMGLSEVKDHLKQKHDVDWKNKPVTRKAIMFLDGEKYYGQQYEITIPLKKGKLTLIESIIGKRP